MLEKRKDSIVQTFDSRLVKLLTLDIVVSYTKPMITIRTTVI
jgi:hypothetical protein